MSTDPLNYKDLVAVVYLSHRAELTVRLDICRKVSRTTGARNRDRVVTLWLSSLEPSMGIQPCLNTGTMGMVPLWRWCSPSTP